VKATIEGLQSLKRPEDVAKLRGKTVAEVLGLEQRPQGESNGDAARSGGAGDARPDGGAEPVQAGGEQSA
jgi:hypothetical protein